MSKVKGKINDLFESQIFIEIVTEKGIKEIEVTIDTGFNGDLVLPKSIISELGFEYLYCLKVGLVGKTIKEVDFFSGQIKWLNNEIITVDVIADESFLIGTNLLRHGKLLIDYQSNEVLITK